MKTILRLEVMQSDNASENGINEGKVPILAIDTTANV